MAEDAQIKVKMDVSAAKRDLDAVNAKMAATAKNTQGLFKTIRGAVFRGVGLAAAAGGVVNQAAGGGFFQALTRTGGALTGAAGRALGLGGEGLMAGIAQSRSLDRAIDATKQLVSAGGTITDDQIQGLITGFEQVFAPGERNVQRVEVQGQDIRVAQVLQNYADTFDRAVRRFERAIAGGG